MREGLKVWIAVVMVILFVLTLMIGMGKANREMEEVENRFFGREGSR